MENSEQKSITPGTWCVPDGDRFARGPITTENGRVVVSELFMQDPDIKDLREKCNSDDILYGLLRVLYFVEIENPMYKGLPRPERIQKSLSTITNKRDLKKAENLMKSQEYIKAKSLYVKLTSTPAQQMLHAFEDECHRFIEKINQGVWEGDELRKNIISGRKMLEEIDSLRSYINKEGQSKTRGDYRPALFERRNNNGLSPIK